MKKLIFALVFSFGIVFMPTSVSAAIISGLSVSPSSTRLGATATYTVSFTAPQDISAGGQQTPGDPISLNFWYNGKSQQGAAVNLDNVSLGSVTVNGVTVNARLREIPSGGESTGTAVEVGSNVSKGAAVVINLNDVVNPSVGGQYSAQVSVGGDEKTGGDTGEQTLFLGVGKVYTLSGTVQLPDGSIPKNAQVSADEGLTGLHVSQNVSSDGSYSVSLPVGNWRLNVEPQWNKQGRQKAVDWAYVGPESTLAIDSDKTKDFTVVPTPNTITGQVTYAGSGKVVTDAMVNANQMRGMGWKNTNVDSNGEYTLKVPEGEWEVRVEPQWGENGQTEVDWALSGRGEVLNFVKDGKGEKKTVNIKVNKATATVKGTVVKPDGSKLDRGWAEVRSKDGAGVGGNVEKGAFSVSVPAGSYRIEIFSDNPDYAPPAVDSFSVKEGETKDLGTIKMVKKGSKIKGKVVDKDSGKGIAGVRVNAWNPEGAGWGETTSGSDGSYSLSVSSGTYEVMAEPSPDSGYATEGGPPRRVTVGKNETKTGENIKLLRAGATIQGTIVDADGNKLTSLFGFAEAMEGDGDPPKPGPGGPAEGGNFSIAVPAGTWTVSVHTEPGADYSFASTSPEMPIKISEGETKKVEVTMKSNDATITGTIKDDSGNLVTGTRVEVFAENGRGSFKFANAEDGTYKLDVIGGDSWYMGVFVEPNSGYMMLPPSDNKTTVKSGQEVTRNFTLLKSNASISGRVLDPGGDPLASVFVFADTNMVEGGDVLGASTVREAEDAGAPVGAPGKGEMGPGVYTGDLTDQDGKFTLEVPAGTYGVGSGAPPSLGYINPEFQEVTVGKNEAATDVTLKYRSSDATISGTVKLEGSKTEAFVWAWSDSGAHSETMTRTGDYTLNVTKGEIWHVGADFESEQSFYQSTERVVDMTNTSKATQNLSLGKADFEIPPSISKQIQAQQGGTITLEDGFKVVVPAGALGNSGTFTLTLTPTAQLIKEKNRRPLAFGYDVRAINSSGQEVTSSFNSNVRLVMPYTEQMLTELGITEDDLSASFFDDTSSGWQGVDGFSVNTDTNTIVASVGHFTEFAVTTGDADTTAPSKPTNLSASAGTQKVTLSWTNPIDSDFSEVNVYRSTTDGEQGSLIVSTSETSYEDTGLTAGTTYYYSLTAVDTVGNESDATSQVSATAQAQPTSTLTPTLTPTSTPASLPSTGTPVSSALMFYFTRLLAVMGLTAPMLLLLRRAR